MNIKQNQIFGRHKQACLLLITILIALSGMTACAPSAEQLAAVDYAPLPGDDWPQSTPGEQGLDPELVAQLYLNAQDVETINALLVIKNGYLVAEDYFNGGSIDQANRIQSATKSYTSALTGIALKEGCLESVDQKMIEFFPELEDRITDPRKKEITIKQMLQMRAGYPWEESYEDLFEMLYAGFYPSYLVDVPLVSDPGTHMEYSNLTSHLIAVIVARACGTDLKSFGEENLFEPLGVELVDWITDWEGNYNGHGDMHFNARDMAKFGLLYVNEGKYNGQQLVPAEWVKESLQTYSEDAWKYKVGRNFKDIGYGYQWWAVTAGNYRYNLAWGHGGQQIAVLDDLDLVVVVKADPLFGQHGDKPWKFEKQNLNLVADFIASLPAE